MTKQLIIYSAFNLDSCFAAVIFKELAIKQNKEVFLIPYNRAKNNSLRSGADEIVVAGADVTGIDMSSLLDTNPDAKMMVQAYPNSETYGSKLLKRFKEREVTYSRFEQDEKLDTSFVGFTISVSLVALAAAKGGDSYFMHNATDYSELAQNIHKYCNFESLNQVKTYNLFSQIPHIENSLQDTKYPFMDKWYGAPLNEEYDKLVKSTRTIIEDNMAMAWYAGANGSGFTTPTISVASANAMLAMRFINYSHNDVISFEDTRDCRVYRILSQRNLEWYLKRFEPTDVWSEGSLVFIKTELPRHVR